MYRLIKCFNYLKGTNHPLQGMGHRVLPDFPEQCNPLTSVIGSRKSNFWPELYTCLADRKRTASRKEDVVEVKEMGRRKKNK